MDIYMIWVRASDHLWLADAWDADSVAENRSGYEEELDQIEAECGHENVRVIRTSVDFNGVENAFDVPFVVSG